MMIPVLNQLRNQHPNYAINILGLTTAAAVLEQHGYNPWGFRHLVQADDEPALLHGRQLARDLPAQQLLDEETEAYLGLSFQDLEQRLDSEEAARLYSEQGRYAFLPLTIMKRAIQKFNPDIIVATNAPRAEQAAIMEGRKANIPTVCLVDLFGLRELDTLRQPDYADRVCVFHESVRQRLIEAGRKPHEVITTGNPAFDYLARPHLKATAQAFRHEKGWQQKKVILWAAPPRYHNPVACELVPQHLQEALEHNPHWHVVIRPHPNDIQSGESVISHPQISYSGASDDLPVLIQAADVVIVVSSTVGLMSILLGVPVIELDIPTGFAQHSAYASQGLAIWVNDMKQLTNIINTIFQEESESQHDNFRPTGKAAANVVEIIQTML